MSTDKVVIIPHQGTFSSVTDWDHYKTISVQSYGAQTQLLHLQHNSYTESSGNIAEDEEERV